MTVLPSALQSYAFRLTSPVHPSFPFPLIDIFGAMRLSSVVNWMAGGALDPPSVNKGSGKRSRPSLLQELFALMVIVFGGETFLCMSLFSIVLCGAHPGRSQARVAVRLHLGS